MSAHRTAGRGSAAGDVRRGMIRYQAVIIGGAVGYWMLRRFPQENVACSAAAYAGRSKLEVLFGPGIWGEVAGRRVLDFGCGEGEETVALARHAREVIGVDIQAPLLERARSRAAGMPNCRFATTPDGPVDRIVSVDGFEHYDDPAGVLHLMAGVLDPDGAVLVVFGPPWFHPYGGHLFSVFPWAHLIFTEAALIRWRSDFKGDGARRFHEVAGGLNGMTVRRFMQTVGGSPLRLASIECVPIRGHHRLARLSREAFTAVVRARLVHRDQR
jgi:SAM-dependent methyltransferase